MRRTNPSCDSKVVILVYQISIPTILGKIFSNENRFPVVVITSKIFSVDNTGRYLLNENALKQSIKHSFRESMEIDFRVILSVWMWFSEIGLLQIIKNYNNSIPEGRKTVSF